jgi:hypothetical protein
MVATNDEKRRPRGHAHGTCTRCLRSRCPCCDPIGPTLRDADVVREMPVHCAWAHTWVEIPNPQQQSSSQSSPRVTRVAQFGVQVECAVRSYMFEEGPPPLTEGPAPNDEMQLSNFDVRPYSERCAIRGRVGGSRAAIIRRQTGGSRRSRNVRDGSDHCPQCCSVGWSPPQHPRGPRGYRTGESPPSQLHRPAWWSSEQHAGTGLPHELHSGRWPAAPPHVAANPHLEA